MPNRGTQAVFFFLFCLVALKTTVLSGILALPEQPWTTTGEVGPLPECPLESTGAGGRDRGSVLGRLIYFF